MFERKFTKGREYARDLFLGLDLPSTPDQAVVLGYATAV